jgi:hypothetical protein
MTTKVKFVLQDHRGDWMEESTVHIEFIPRIGETVRIFDHSAKVADVHYDFAQFSGHSSFKEVTVYLAVKY